MLLNLKSKSLLFCHKMSAKMVLSCLCYTLEVNLRLGGWGGPPTHHPPQGRILTSFCPFLLHGADNERRIELIYAFFMLQGAGD